jgi:nitroreductase/NAD-dependent dihydropyrimidine dehydrogenase PreA subunit
MPTITIDEQKCKRDGICVAECPLGVIERTDERTMPRPTEDADEFCIKCGHCVAVCPHGALAHRECDPADCQPIRKELSLSQDQIRQFLMSRRSVRNYRDKPVDRDILEKIFHVVRYAPTGHNDQQVKWLVIQDQREVQRFAGMVADWMRYMIKEMPTAIANLHFERVVKRWEGGRDIICRNAPHIIMAYGSSLDPSARSSCLIALAHLELAVRMFGLGACWAGYFHLGAMYWPPMIKEINLPENHEPYGAMMIGYPQFAYHRIPKRNEPAIQWR